MVISNKKNKRPLFGDIVEDKLKKRALRFERRWAILIIIMSVYGAFDAPTHRTDYYYDGRHEPREAEQQTVLQPIHPDQPNGRRVAASSSDSSAPTSADGGRVYVGQRESWDVTIGASAKYLPILLATGGLYAAHVHPLLKAIAQLPPPTVGVSGSCPEISGVTFPTFATIAAVSLVVNAVIGILVASAVGYMMTAARHADFRYYLLFASLLASAGPFIALVVPRGKLLASMVVNALLFHPSVIVTIAVILVADVFRKHFVGPLTALHTTSTGLALASFVFGFAVVSAVAVDDPAPSLSMVFQIAFLISVLLAAYATLVTNQLSRYSYTPPESETDDTRRTDHRPENEGGRPALRGESSTSADWASMKLLATFAPSANPSAAATGLTRNENNNADPIGVGRGGAAEFDGPADAMGRKDSMPHLPMALPVFRALREFAALPAGHVAVILAVHITVALFAAVLLGLVGLRMADDRFAIVFGFIAAAGLQYPHVALHFFEMRPLRVAIGSSLIGAVGAVALLVVVWVGYVASHQGGNSFGQADRQTTWSAYLIVALVGPLVLPAVPCALHTVHRSSVDAPSVGSAVGVGIAVGFGSFEAALTALALAGWCRAGDHGSAIVPLTMAALAACAFAAVCLSAALFRFRRAVPLLDV